MHFIFWNPLFETFHLASGEGGKSCWMLIIKWNFFRFTSSPTYFASEQVENVALEKLQDKYFYIKGLITKSLNSVFPDWLSKTIHKFIIKALNRGKNSQNRKNKWLINTRKNFNLMTDKEKHLNKAMSSFKLKLVFCFLFF